MPPPPPDPSIRAIRAVREYPWRLFWFLLAASVLSLCAVLPYALALFRKMVSPGLMPLSLPALYAVESLQATLTFGVLIGLGLWLGRKAGIRAPFLEAKLNGRPSGLSRDALFTPVLIGLCAGALTTIILATLFLPLRPDSPILALARLPVWKRVLACFYGGINEVIMVQLFLLSLVLWLFGKIGRTGAPRLEVFWLANLLTSLIYAALHLPAMGNLMPLTSSVIVATLVLQGGFGLVLGYLSWRRGLEAAMLASFAADIVVQVLAPMFV